MHVTCTILNTSNSLFNQTYFWVHLCCILNNLTRSHFNSVMLHTTSAGQIQGFLKSWTLCNIFQILLLFSQLQKTNFLPEWWNNLFTQFLNPHVLPGLEMVTLSLWKSKLQSLGCLQILLLLRNSYASTSQGVYRERNTTTCCSIRFALPLWLRFFD